MSTCARNLPQHFNGCACTPAPGGATAEADVDLASTVAPDAAFLHISAHGGQTAFVTTDIDTASDIKWDWNGFPEVHDKANAVIAEHDLASVLFTRKPHGPYDQWDNEPGDYAYYTFKTEAEATAFAERIADVDIEDGFAEYEAEDVDPTGDNDCSWHTTVEVTGPPSTWPDGEPDDLQVEADFANAMLTDSDQMTAPAEPDPVVEEWRNTPTFLVMHEPLPAGTPKGWSGASVMSTNGTRWNLRFIPKGSIRYGNTAAAEDTVAFYDAAFVKDTEPHGRKVSDYYLDTLMPENGPHVASGLNLHMGVPAWQIDAESMRAVLDWANMSRP